MVEIASGAQLAHLFGWALKKHTILAFALYTAGECLGACALRLSLPLENLPIRNRMRTDKAQYLLP